MGRVLKASDPGASGILPVSPELLENFPQPELPRPAFMNDRNGDPSSPSSTPEALRQALLDQAREDADRQIREACAEGYQRGYQAGEEAFNQSVAGAEKSLENAAVEIRKARATFLDSLQNEVLELSVLIAERVLQREIHMDRDLVLNTARRALAQLTELQQVRILVHPGDLEVLRAHKITLLENFEEIGHLEVLPSQEVTPGGCIVETDQAYVDATLGNLLAKVLETLAD